jgi:hypothetical protein
LATNRFYEPGRSFRVRELAVQFDPEFVVDAHAVDRCARSSKCRVFTNVNAQDLGLDELLNDWADGAGNG